MITKISWEEFQKSGMLWWVNRILHTFGFAIVLETDDEDKIIEGYPARSKFRGFSRDVEEEGFKKVSKYMVDNATELNKDV